MDLQTLINEYVTLQQNTPYRGRPRSSQTISHYKQALEGLMQSMADAQLPLDKLPADFIATKWMESQKALWNQAVNLRIRMGAVRRFSEWLFERGITMAPQNWPDIATPEKAVAPAPPPIPPSPLAVQQPPVAPQPPRAPPVAASVAPPQNPLYVVPSLPTTPTPPPAATLPPITQTTEEFETTMTFDDINSIPEADPLPVATVNQPQVPQQSMFGTVTSQQRAKAPIGSGRSANPLANMLPNAQYKLRVWREPENGTDPVFCGDYPGDRVQSYGSVEQFLTQFVGTRLVSSGIIKPGDVTFQVCGVNPQAQMGAVSRMPVTVQPQSPPVVQSQVTTPAAPALSEVDMLKAELAELKAKAAQPQPAAPAPQQPSELDSIKGMLGQLAGAVQSLAARVEERESAPPESTQLGGLPPQPQLNILDIVRAMKEMQPAPVAPVAPVQQPMGMLEMMKMITDMKSVFQPQNINVDTSPLEDRIEELQKRLDAATKDKPSELTNLVAGIKAIREVTGLMDGKLPEKPQGFMGVLSGIVERIAENPAPLAEAAERVFTAARGGAAAQPVAPSIPEDVRSSMEAMLRAQTSEQVLVATHTWLTAMGNHQEMQGIVTRISNLLQSGKAVQLNLVIKEVFKKFGYEKYATTEKVSAIVSHVLAQVQAANAEKQAKEAQKLAAAAEAEEDADDEDDDEGEEDEEPKSPDMTVTVGGASAAGPDDVEPEEEPEEPEHEEAEDAPPEMEVAPEPEPEEEPAPEPKKKRKSRKKKSTPAEVAE